MVPGTGGTCPNGSRNRWYLEPGVPVDDAIKAVEKLILQRKVDFLVGGPVRSEAALAVMDLLWDSESPMTARQLRERLYPDADKAQVVSVVDDRDDQSWIEIHRHPDVHRSTVDDVVARDRSDTVIVVHFYPRTDAHDVFTGVVRIITS